MGVSSFPKSFGFRFIKTGAVGLAFAAGVSAGYGCSVCGCSLSSDWALQGYRDKPGLQVDVRYEYYEQNDLRSGTHSVDTGSIALPAGDEIQLSTLNRNVWLGLDYAFNSKWGVSAQLPYYDRSHSTIAAGDTAVSTSHADGIGDLRLLGRYQFAHDMRGGWGVQFGLKLPTGGFHQTFDGGPQAGAGLDRGLQLGTGTTDALLGLAYFGRPTVNIGWFAQALLQRPLDEREDFRPSTSLGVNGGVRWLNTSRFTPELQVNVRFDGREGGVQGDYDNSGDTLVNLNPGVTVDLSNDLDAFVFVQVPVYQKVKGLQLEPEWLLSLGVRYKL
ncbi:MAG TPA: hypothetical protein VL357_00245 [Rariglobus sp.]|jgi:hypothetical protein|nr:hypothetical protein [Rariglobus sp.]